MPVEAKICSKCETDYPATTDYFHRNLRDKCGLQPKCKQCRMKYNRQHQKEMAEYNKKYRQQHHKKIVEQKKEDYSTLNGRLGYLYRAMKQRCTNSNRHNYHRYGGRGIECKFVSLNGFRNYVKGGMGITNVNQIKDLQIDRIDNDGHYEPDNIRFITCRENSRNK